MLKSQSIPNCQNIFFQTALCPLFLLFSFLVYADHRKELSFKAQPTFPYSLLGEKCKVGHKDHYFKQIVGIFEMEKIH